MEASSQFRTSPAVRGRFAPSPSGPLHIGNARTALLTWLSVRAQGGTLVWRLEDLDGPRTVVGMPEQALSDLAWLGLDWDEGGELGGPHAPYTQSQRSDRYEDALRRLHTGNRIFPCSRSRSDLRTIASAPHGPAVSSPYPASLRPTELQPGWLEAIATTGTVAAVRFAAAAGVVAFDDGLFGNQTENVTQVVGDFVLKRRDGQYAYQLAVVVDDLDMNISEVVRGADLLSSTARQIQLIGALGGSIPRYVHVPLVLNAAGEKLSKRDEGLTVATMRETGVDARHLCGYLAYSAGLLARPLPLHPRELVDNFAWNRVAHTDWRLPEDLPAALR